MRAQQAASSVIDQARLFQGTPESPAVAVDANGTAIGPGGETSPDDSFGAQMLLKDQPKVRSFTFSAGVHGYFTSNVALTRRATRTDAFFVVDASGNWTHALSPELETFVGLQASTFRYTDSSALDFNSLGVGTGLSWTSRRWPGVNFFGRYDFTELLNRDGNEVLSDHQFSVGAQKIYALGRAHAISFGLVGSVGISAPFAAQRDQVGPFVAYQLRLTRALDTSVSYRLGYQIYTSGNRQDWNQVFAWSLRYHFNDWADAAASFSLGGNRSNVSVFDYDVVSSGAGVSFTTRF